MTTEIKQIQIRRDTSANWASANPTMAVSEMGVDTDVGRFKIGDGSTAWSSLAFSTGDADTISVTQTAHGFVAGNTLKPLAAGTYEKATADSLANAQSVGIVSEVYDANNFEMITTKREIILTVGEWDTVCDESIPTGLTVDTIYYLSPDNAGQITSVKTTTDSEVDKTILVALSTTRAIFINANSSLITLSGATPEKTGIPNTGSSLVKSPENHVHGIDMLLKGDYKGLESYRLSVSTLQVKIESLVLTDDNNLSAIKRLIDETFAVSDIQGAAGEATSTWYHAWIAINSAGTIEIKLVPEVTGTATSGTSGTNLEDDVSSQFITELINAGNNGAIIYNNTQNTKTKVSVVVDADNLTLAETGIFADGDDYTIFITKPTFTAGYNWYAYCNTAVYNDSGDDFTWFDNDNGSVNTENVQVLTAGAAGTPTEIRLETAIPANAKKIAGYNKGLRTGGDITRIILIPTSTATRAAKELSSLGISTVGGYEQKAYTMKLSLSQAMYYTSAQGGQDNYVTDYEL